MHQVQLTFTHMNKTRKKYCTELHKLCLLAVVNNYAYLSLNGSNGKNPSKSNRYKNITYVSHSISADNDTLSGIHKRRGFFSVHFTPVKMATKLDQLTTLSARTLQLTLFN